MKKIKDSSVYKNIAKLFVSWGLKNPSVPHAIGFSLFRKKSVWKLNFLKCPCDEHFIDYLVDYNISDKNIFHFGTGEHHYVGLQNFKLKLKNYVFGITPAIKEFEAYFKLSLETPFLTTCYKVLCADIYTLNKYDISFFDIVTFFHLCEFSDKNNKLDYLLDDLQLVDLFLDRMNSDGKLIFYAKSAGWSQAEIVIRKLVDSHKISFVKDFKSLKIYKKNEL